jgi:formylmethanofuran dehydrogenase subunit B
MNTHQRLIISLREFLKSGEILLANLDNSRLAYEYLDNSIKIKKYIFDKYYHDSVLRQYYYDLPKVNPELLSNIGESTLEKIINIRKKSSYLFEMLGIIVSPEKEKNRNELMLLVSDINNKTRLVLQKIEDAK